MLRKLATAVLSCLVRDWSRKYHSLAATYGTAGTVVPASTYRSTVLVHTSGTSKYLRYPRYVPGRLWQLMACNGWPYFLI